jgi:CRP-like cAMP-binding protein
MRVQCFGPGETVIREGEKGERFYIINDGEVAVSKGETEITRLSNQVLRGS